MASHSNRKRNRIITQVVHKPTGEPNLFRREKEDKPQNYQHFRSSCFVFYLHIRASDNLETNCWFVYNLSERLIALLWWCLCVSWSQQWAWWVQCYHNWSQWWQNLICKNKTWVVIYLLSSHITCQDVTQIPQLQANATLQFNFNFNFYWWKQRYQKVNLSVEQRSSPERRLKWASIIVKYYLWTWICTLCWDSC